jgi:hypothetical protein
MSGEDWSAEELEALERIFPLGDRKALGSALPSRSISAIRQKARLNGVVWGKRRSRWTYAEERLLKEKYPHSSWSVLCKSFPKRTRETIARKAVDLGLRRVKREYNPSPYPIIRELRALRQQRKIPLSVLAHKIGCHKIQLTRWETGDQMPRARSLFDWAQSLGATVTLRATEIVSITAPKQIDHDDCDLVS